MTRLQREVFESSRRLRRIGISLAVLAALLVVAIPFAVNDAARSTAAELSESYGLEITEDEAHSLN